MSDTYLRLPKVRDAQRLNVYRWEWDLKKHYGDMTTIYTMDDIRRLIEFQYLRVRTFIAGAPLPKIKVNRRKRTYSTYFGFRQHEIHLHKDWGRQAVVVLHEVCHSIVACWQVMINKRVAPHGPTFTGLFASMLNDWFGIPLDALYYGHNIRKTARQRVHFAPRVPLVMAYNRACQSVPLDHEFVLWDYHDVC